MASLPEEKWPIMDWNEEDRVKAWQEFKEKMLFCFKVEEGGEYADILLRQMMMAWIWVGFNNSIKKSDSY